MQPIKTGNIAFITHCDINYLSRALALIESISKTGFNSNFYVLCHDNLAYEALSNLALDRVIPLSRNDVYQLYPELRAAEFNRTPLEYFYCFSPFLLLFLKSRGYETVTYLDSDLYFFQSPENIFAEFSNNDVGIVPHRFSEEDRHLEKYGIYNVGLVMFKNSERGCETLNWWAQACLKSTKLEVTPNSFGDQKYLEFFQFQGGRVHIFNSYGQNAAPWNTSSAELKSQGYISINASPLIYYHYSGLRIYKNFALLGFTSYRKRPNKVLRKYVYKAYIKKVNQWENKINNPNRIDYRSKSIRDIANAIKYRDISIFW